MPSVEPLSPSAPFQQLSSLSVEASTPTDAFAALRKLVLEVLERDKAVAAIFDGQAINATEVESYKSIVNEHLAELCARYVTIGKASGSLLPPPEAVSMGTADLTGDITKTAAYKFALQSGFTNE